MESKRNKACSSVSLGCVKQTNFDLKSNLYYGISEKNIELAGKEHFVNFDDIAEVVCLLKEISDNPAIIDYPDNRKRVKRRNREYYKNARKRLTDRNCRKGKNGVYNPKHNERN